MSLCLDDTVAVDSELEARRRWLKDNTEPWSDVEKYMKLTYEARLKHYKDTGLEICDYYIHYDAFKEPKGYLLVSSNLQQWSVIPFMSTILIYPQLLLMYLYKKGVKLKFQMLMILGIYPCLYLSIKNKPENLMSCKMYTETVLIQHLPQYKTEDSCKFRMI